MATHKIRREIPRLALNQQEAAAALGVSVNHFERHIKPHLPVVLSGAKRLCAIKALERWIEEHSFEGGRR